MNFKEIFKDGSLTLEQFEDACKQAGVKLVDVSSGEYVSKNKYDDEIKQRDQRIQTLSDTVSARETDIKNLNDQISTSEGTHKNTLDAVQNQLAALQKQYDSDKEKYAANIAQQKYEYAVKEFANGKKFTSNAARRDFVSTMIAKALTMENDTILGAEDFANAYATENEDAFVVESTEDKKLPQFSTEPEPAESSSEANPFNFNFTSIR